MAGSARCPLTSEQHYVYDYLNRELPEKLVPLFRLRDEFGRAKYGTSLATNNGRDFLKDAVEECVDLVAYLRGAQLEGIEVTQYERQALDLLEGILVIKAIRDIASFGEPPPTVTTRDSS